MKTIQNIIDELKNGEGCVLAESDYMKMIRREEGRFGCAWSDVKRRKGHPVLGKFTSVIGSGKDAVTINGILFYDGYKDDDDYFYQDRLITEVAVASATFKSIVNYRMCEQVVRAVKASEASFNLRLVYQLIGALAVLRAERGHQSVSIDVCVAAANWQAYTLKTKNSPSLIQYIKEMQAKGYRHCRPIP